MADGGKRSVDKFQDPELEVTHIDSLEWLSDQKLEILTTHGGGCNPKIGIVRNKRFFYNLETGEVESELLEEGEVRG